MYKYLLLFLITFSGLFAQKKPNIVLIISDDHAFQTIGAYNKKKRSETPHIDRIANEGILFNKAYVTNSICGPSRACILTGKYSNKNGYTDNETSTYNSNQQQFSNILQSAGYQTAWIGKYHLGDNPKGFDFFKILVGQGYYFNPDFIIEGQKIVREEGYVSNIIENEAEKWLDNRNREKPFCLIIGHKATHRTWMPDLPDLGRYETVNFPVPDTFFDNYQGRIPASEQEMSIGKDMRMEYDLKMFATNPKDRDSNFNRMNPEQIKAYQEFYTSIEKAFRQKNLSEKELALWKYQRYMRDYMATAHSMDKNIGRLLDYLEKNQLKDNTMVVYLSDQGFYMGEHGWFDKRFMYEESFRTPMMLSYPKLKQKGVTTEQFVMNIDLAPTFLQLAGIKIPEEMQGKSLLPLLEKKKATLRKAIFYHYYENGEHAVSPHFGVRTNRYKLIRFYKRYNGWEFYDLDKDPNELHNCYQEKGYERIIQQMKSLLLDEIRDKEDKLAEDIFFNKEFTEKNHK